MSYKNITCLLLLAVIATTAYSRRNITNDVWECQHDHIKRADPDIVEIDEDYDPKGDNNHTARTLTTYNNIKMYGYYGALDGTSAFNSYIENELIPPILSYWSAALLIKYPVSGDLKISTSTVCGVTTPSVLKTGVSADFVYIVTVDDSSSYVASSGACSLASGTNRPIVGHTVISSYYLDATTDVLLHERNMICIMHEVVHTLGWTNGMYANWLNYQTGEKISDPTTTLTLDGDSAIVIQAEPIRTMVRNYFGCSTIAGAYMENTGSSGTAGCHFERRQYTYEAMTSGLIYQMQFSQFTLGMLESMGWYVPNYAYADPFFFGQGKGCNFLTESCTTANTAFTPNFCSSSSRGCTTPGRSGAVCESDARSDGCQFWWPELDYDCENTGAASYARLASIQSFGRGVGSKCFTGTLNSGSAGSETSFCFKHTCSGSGTSTSLTLTVGTKSVACTKAGAVSVSGYAGTITCPDPVTFCSTVGQKVCPRNCMGRGTCTNGVCVCNSGASGEDCALIA